MVRDHAAMVGRFDNKMSNDDCVVSIAQRMLCCVVLKVNTENRLHK